MMSRHPTLPCLLLTLCAGAAQAETSPWYIGASQAYTHSSNLLRLSDGEAAPAGASQSDTVSSTALLGGLDQTIGRQRVFGNLVLRSNRMRHNEVYDNEGYAVTAGIDWQTVEHVSGSIKGSTQRNLASFNADEIGRIEKKNLETTKQLDATVRVGGVGELTAEATAGARSVSYSAFEYASRAFHEDRGSVGLRWRPDGTTTLGMAVRLTKGRYPSFRSSTGGSVADRFDRRDLDLSANLQPSGASNIDARVSFGKTEYEVATQRDFSGVTGLLRWVWQATGKLRLDTRLSRDPSQDSYFFQTPFAADSTVEYSRLTTALRMRADYEASAKVRLNAGVSYARRSLVNTLPTFAGELARSGSDRSTGLTLGAAWTPVRSLQFGCDLSRERRSSDSTLSSSYGDTTVSCFGQATLQ